MPDARLTTKREGVNIRRLPHFDGLNSGASIGGANLKNISPFGLA